MSVSVYIAHNASSTTENVAPDYCYYSTTATITISLKDSIKSDEFLRKRAVADPKILKGGTEDNLSAYPSSFIANAHNEIYAFYTEKAAF